MTIATDVAMPAFVQSWKKALVFVTLPPPPPSRLARVFLAPSQAPLALMARRTLVALAEGGQQATSQQTYKGLSLHRRG